MSRQRNQNLDGLLCLIFSVLRSRGLPIRKSVDERRERNGGHPSCLRICHILLNADIWLQFHFCFVWHISWECLLLRYYQKLKQANKCLLTTSAGNPLEVEILVQAPKSQRHLSACLSKDSMLNSF